MKPNTITEPNMDWWREYVEQCFAKSDGYLLLYKRPNDIWKVGGYTYFWQFANITQNPYPGCDAATFQISQGQITAVWINGEQVDLHNVHK